jgi:hypothetical protein
MPQRPHINYRDSFGFFGCDRGFAFAIVRNAP